MLDVTVVARHVRLTDGVRQYAAEKVEKLDRFPLKKVEVILSDEATRYRAEMIASTRRGKRFIAGAESGDLHGAIDLTVEKLESQLSRSKGKAKERRDRRSITAPNEEPTPDESDADEEARRVDWRETPD